MNEESKRGSFGRATRKTDEDEEDEHMTLNTCQAEPPSQGYAGIANRSPNFSCSRTRTRSNSSRPI
jgi:hypothetical protein